MELKTRCPHLSRSTCGGCSAQNSRSGKLRSLEATAWLRRMFSIIGKVNNPTQNCSSAAGQPYSNCGVHSVVWIFAIREEALGPHHPHTANGLNDLATLLTKCLCGETNGEPEPPGSTFSPQTQPPRGCCLGLAMRKKPVLWPFFALSVGLLTGLTAFRSEYLAPQELRTSENVSGGRLSGEAEACRW